MSVDQQLAASLGFPKPAYMAVERERRWLCHAVPAGMSTQIDCITDLYVTGTRLRLREARPLSGGPAIRRFSRKADVDAHTRLITTLYLSEDEFALLSQLLPGKRIQKRRHRLAPVHDIAMAIDEFQGELAGLVMLEVEFDSPEQMASFSAPDFAGVEVTEDPRFNGGALVQHGLPADFPDLLNASAT